MIDPKDTRMDGLDEALLPCPFCGCEVELVSSKNAPERLLVIACKSPSPCIGSGLGGFYILESQRAEGIAAWNRRSTIGGEPVGFASAGGIDNLRLGFSATIVAPAVADEQFNRPLFAHPASSTGEGVKVKALEWIELTSPREDGPAEPTGEFEALCVFGNYSVSIDADEDMTASPYVVWSPEDNLGHFSSADEAKAAAQADYQARIRSALVHPSIADTEAGAALRIESEAAESFHRRMVAAEAQVTRLTEALSSLVAKLDAIDKPVTDVFAFAGVHGYHYDGPNYADELKAAKFALVDNPSPAKTSTGE